MNFPIDTYNSSNYKSIIQTHKAPLRYLHKSNPMWALSENSFFVIVRLDRTIQNRLRILVSPIKSGNDRVRKS